MNKKKKKSVSKEGVTLTEAVMFFKSFAVALENGRLFIGDGEFPLNALNKFKLSFRCERADDKELESDLEVKFEYFQLVVTPSVEEIVEADTKLAEGASESAQTAISPVPVTASVVSEVSVDTAIKRELSDISEKQHETVNSDVRGLKRK